MHFPPRPRKGAVAAFATVALTFALALAGRAADAKAPEIYPLAKVKPGQKGYGLTAFTGTTPERFEFEVVGVMKNFLPKMDIILVKSDDPKITVTGFAQGMSGSPLYLEGKVVCAFSYGFRFNKMAIGGCTPLEYMLEESKLPVRGPAATALATAEEWERHEPVRGFEEGRDVTARADLPPDSWLTRSPLPTAPPAPAPDREDSLVRAGVPLSVSGLGPTAFEQARKVFEPFGIEPMQAGGGGQSDRGPTAFEMGAPLGVVLARGDLSAVATGTVSYVDGNQILAFGHPMFQMGETYMPVSSAEIHTIIPSAMSAFKLSSPLRILGSLVQDRQSMIMADAGKKADLIPVDVKIKGPGREESFHVEIVRNRFLTPPLAMMAVVNGAQLIAPDITDCVVTVQSNLHLRGFKPLTFVDYVYSPEGASGNAVAAARGLRILGPLLFNPWAPVTVDRIELTVSVEYKSDYVTVTALRVSDTEVPYGEKFYVDAIMQPYNGKPYVEKIPVTIPERLAGSTVKLEVVSGDGARMDAAAPETLDQLIDMLREKTYPGNVLVATLYIPDEGVTLNGRVVPDLPDSALDTARPAASTRRIEAYKAMLRAVIPAKRVVQGRQEIVLKVEDKR